MNRKTIYGSCLGMCSRLMGFCAVPLNITQSLLAMSIHKLNLGRARLQYQGLPDDIFIMSYPKSGTTWMQMILYQLMTDGVLNKHIDEFAPHFEATLIPMGRKVDDLKQPRIIKSHLSYKRTPKGPGRYIYLMRDGRDVAMSFYHYIESGSDFELFLSRFIHGRLPYGSWFTHVAKWTENKDNLKLLIVKYEELVKDLGSTIREIAAFCDIEIDESQFPRILQNCTFSSMREQEARLSGFTRGGPVPTIIRKGQVGGWREHFTQSMSEKYRAEFGRHLVEPVFGDYQM